MGLAVLITGPSASGKSTVAKLLVEKSHEYGIAAITVGLDGFIVPSKVPGLGTSKENWESPNIINWSAFEQALQEAYNRFPLVFAEGFIVTNSRYARKIAAKTIYLDKPIDSVFAGRIRRNEITGGPHLTDSDYHNNVLAPAINQYVRPQMLLPNTSVFEVNAYTSYQALTNAIWEEINPLNCHCQMQ